MCIDCFNQTKRKVARPNKEELLKLLLNKSFVSIGKLYNVSDSTIRKWCKYYELPYKQSDIIELKCRLNGVGL